jgi:WhiB family redox-sensing transcriptional regulator
VTIDVGNEIGGTGFGRTEVRTAADALGLHGLRSPWMRDAACREHPETTFFSSLGEPSEPARTVCQRCLVPDECLAFALEHDERNGVWCGLYGWRGKAVAHIGISTDLARLRPTPTRLNSGGAIRSTFGQRLQQPDGNDDDRSKEPSTAGGTK